MTFSLFIINRKSGKVFQQVDGNFKAMLDLYCIYHLTKTRDGIIFDNKSGNAIAWWEGRGKDIPPIKKDVTSANFEIIR